MGENPYERYHPKSSMSLEVNFRSFLAGEGERFVTPVPVDDLVAFASVGSPITIPAGAGYSVEDLRAVAQAVRVGGGTLTIREAKTYPAEVLARLEEEAPRQIRLA